MKFRFVFSRALFSVFLITAGALVLSGVPDGGGFPLQAEAQQKVKLTFESGIDPALETMISSGGEILVKPKINDQEVGWFLIDPAVEGMRIAASLAEGLELDSSGTHHLVTTSKAEERRGWRCPVFVAGPCRAEGLILTEMADEAGEEEGGEAVVGVIGTALLRGVVAEVDMESGEVRLYDPESYDDTRTDWREFRLSHSLPVVRCRFEGDAEGEFGLDLRSPLGIIFFKPTVEAMGFLKNKVTRPGTISGENFGKASVRIGIMEWFEAAGLRLEKTWAVFLTEDIAFPGSGELSGLIGREALREGILTLDYSRTRLAVTAKER
ncbi:MAG: hypothetical protein JW747_08520 [Candidatus Aminicenantes bacterium]|nr:hypothetical protein [Candidatus Aminicenantes bacterium]